MVELITNHLIMIFSTVSEDIPINYFSCLHGCTWSLELPTLAVATLLFFCVPLAFATAWFLSRKPRKEDSDSTDIDTE